MIVNELRLSFVTIVTESAIFVTIVVTGSGQISKILHCGDNNNSGKREKRPVFRIPGTCQECVTSFTREMSVTNL